MYFINLLKTKLKLRQFKKYAKIGKKIKFGPICLCRNGSGNPMNITIADNSYIMGTICTQGNGKIVIGDHFYLGPGSFIGAVESIVIGRCVIISNDVKIYDNNNHPTSPKEREFMSMSGFSNDNWLWKHADRKPVIIEDNVWIGGRVIILPGVHIGSHVIIGAGSVVTKDIPNWAVAAGNPAVVKKFRKTNME